MPGETHGQRSLKGYSPEGHKELDMTEANQHAHACTLLPYTRASQVALVVKNSTANAEEIRDSGLFPGLGRIPGGGHGHPLQYSCLENPHGQRNLGGYSPWGHKESDMTERPTHFVPYTATPLEFLFFSLS